MPTYRAAIQVTSHIPLTAGTAASSCAHTAVTSLSLSLARATVSLILLHLHWEMSCKGVVVGWCCDGVRKVSQCCSGSGSSGRSPLLEEASFHHSINWSSCSSIGLSFSLGKSVKVNGSEEHQYSKLTLLHTWLLLLLNVQNRIKLTQKTPTF